ncbi:hypothetical protein ACN27E_23110 [Mycobacterium sp. WMMD1722]|uniref:hypothetical protein n=1 Tax=Mycobacterium sp. WMMD1722 TaxID=3404117 RepID=UPI003BF5E495
MAQALLGAVWAVGGVVIGLGPPLSETGRGASSPHAGWAFAAFGVYLLINGFRRAAAPADRAAPRHGSGREPDRRTAILVPLCTLLVGVAGVGGLWWGIAARDVTIGAFGVLAASFALAAAPVAGQSLRSRRRGS